MKNHAMLLCTLLLVSCSFGDGGGTGNEPVRVESGSGYIRRETIHMAIPQGTPEVPGHGKEIGFAYGAVAGLEQTVANGVASVHYLEDKTSIVGIQVNIAIPADGFFYEAWISNGDKTAAISLGHLTNPFNDVRHSLQTESSQDLSGLHHLAITLEADDGNPAQSAPVASAILKPTSR